MSNPWATRWTRINSNEDRHERALAQYEAADAEACDVLACGNCGQSAYYRPGVGAYQCPACRSLLISKVVDGNVVENWVS
jgi:hypothetical protein